MTKIFGSANSPWILTMNFLKLKSQVYLWFPLFLAQTLNIQRAPSQLPFTGSMWFLRFLLLKKKPSWKYLDRLRVSRLWPSLQMYLGSSTNGEIPGLLQSEPSDFGGLRGSYFYDQPQSSWWLQTWPFSAFRLLLLHSSGEIILPVFPQYFARKGFGCCQGYP